MDWLANSVEPRIYSCLGGLPGDDLNSFSGLFCEIIGSRLFMFEYAASMPVLGAYRSYYIEARAPPLFWVW